MKKLLLGLLASATIATSAIAITSCGKETNTTTQNPKPTPETKGDNSSATVPQAAKVINIHTNVVAEDTFGLKNPTLDLDNEDIKVSTVSFLKEIINKVGLNLFTDRAKAISEVFSGEDLKDMENKISIATAKHSTKDLIETAIDIKLTVDGKQHVATITLKKLLSNLLGVNPDIKTEQTNFLGTIIKVFKGEESMMKLSSILGVLKKCIIQQNEGEGVELFANKVLGKLSLMALKPGAFEGFSLKDMFKDIEFKVDLSNQYSPIVLHGLLPKSVLNKLINLDSLKKVTAHKTMEEIYFKPQLRTAAVKLMTFNFSNFLISKGTHSRNWTQYSHELARVYGAMASGASISEEDAKAFFAIKLKGGNTLEDQFKTIFKYSENGTSLNLKDEKETAIFFENQALSLLTWLLPTLGLPELHLGIGAGQLDKETQDIMNGLVNPELLSFIKGLLAPAPTFMNKDGQIITHDSDGKEIVLIKDPLGNGYYKKDGNRVYSEMELKDLINKQLNKESMATTVASLITFILKPSNENGYIDRPGETKLDTQVEVEKLYRDFLTAIFKGNEQNVPQFMKMLGLDKEIHTAYYDQSTLSPTGLRSQDLITAATLQFASLI